MPKITDILFDSLAYLVDDVTTDIRQHVIEEPWFGHPVTDGPANYYEGFWERYGTPDTWREQTPEISADQELEPDLSIDIDP